MDVKQMGVRMGLVTLFCVSLLTAATGPAVGSHSIHLSDQVDRETYPQQTTATNNSTVQHERPDNVDQPGDSQQVSQWIEGELTSQLQGSAIEISQGEYERARELVGDDYNTRLEQYVDVAGETEGSDDDEATETFNETRNNQEEYAESVQSYEETYEDYQQARENGNTTAAREYARELENQSERITALNQSLNQNYVTLQNQTGVSMNEPREAITNQTQEVLIQQETVREQTFVETVLDLTANDTAISFADPLHVAGRLTTTNGTSVANRTIRLQVFQQTYETTTDRNGSFEVVHRPVSLPTDTTNVTVRFLPAGLSPYLGSATSVPVDVTQETPSLDIGVSPSEAGYDDQVRTQVVATVDGQPVPGLPIQSVLGTTVTTGRTDEQGRLSLSGRVPASLPSGQQSVVATHDRETLAVGPISVETPLRITSTSTNLTAVTQASAERVLVRGRLTTVDGTAVSRQSVTVSVGETVQSTTTNQTGWYQIAVRNVSTADTANQSVLSVVVRFDGDGTNLESARTETTVSVPNVSQNGSEGDGSGDALVVVGGIVLLSSLGASLLWFRRNNDSTDAEPSPPTTATEPQTNGGDSVTTPWLDHAQSALSDDDIEQATVAAYASVREHANREAQLPNSLTHREFLAACESAETDIDPATISVVADAYEQATFAPTLDATTATKAVEAAGDLAARFEPVST